MGGVICGKSDKRASSVDSSDALGAEDSNLSKNTVTPLKFLKEYQLPSDMSVQDCLECFHIEYDDLKEEYKVKNNGLGIFGSEGEDDLNVHRVHDGDKEGLCWIDAEGLGLTNKGIEFLNAHKET